MGQVFDVAGRRKGTLDGENDDGGDGGDNDDEHHTDGDAEQRNCDTDADAYADGDGDGDVDGDDYDEEGRLKEGRRHRHGHHGRHGRRHGQTHNGSPGTGFIILCIGNTCCFVNWATVFTEANGVSWVVAVKVVAAEALNVIWGNSGGNRGGGSI